VIYLFHGSDAGKARAKAFAWIAAARAKQPDAGYLRLGADELTEANLAQIAGTQGLFFKRTLALIDDPFALKDAGETLLEHIDMLASSENPIAILAPNLLAARAKKFEAKAEKVFVADGSAKEKRGFNSALVNALAAKDGPTLWKELAKAERAGDAPEMLHGLLHWKARNLMEKGGGKWGSADARKLSRDLIELLSDSRSGDLPLRESLERFALSL
jgi:hypothetical protein